MKSLKTLALLVLGVVFFVLVQSALKSCDSSIVLAQFFFLMTALMIYMYDRKLTEQQQVCCKCNKKMKEAIAETEKEEK